MRNTLKAFMLMCILAVIVSIGYSDRVFATGEGNPRLMVESYVITNDEVVPGEEFELTLKIRNTSIFYDTYSVIVDVTDETGSVYPVYGFSDQRYIERVYARNSWDITIPLKASENIKLTTIPLLITITYNDNYFIDKQKNETRINLPVRLSGDLNLISCTVPEKVSQGTKARISATYENKGSKSLYNVIMTVIPPNAENAVETNLYSIVGGKQNTAEVYMECKEVGDLPVDVIFTYENEQGEVFQTEAYRYEITVTEPGVSELGDSDVTIVGGGVKAVTYILTAAIVIIAILILFIIKGRRR